jgi:hypothetical protein
MGNPGITAKERNYNTIPQEKESFYCGRGVLEFQAPETRKCLDQWSGTKQVRAE